MKPIIKAIIYILTFSLFGILIFSSFLSPQYKKIQSLPIGKTLSKNEVLNNTGGTDVILIENFSKLDSIYYSQSGSYNKKENNNNINIELKKGQFLLKINDLTKNYSFSHKGFTIQPLGPGIFYINTQNKNNIKIISKESILNIGFRDLSSGEVINNAYLYPHEYILINPFRNRSIKDGADFIRVKAQVFKSGYINNKISYKNTENSLVGRILGNKNLYFINNSLKKISEINDINKVNYDDIEKLSYWTFPGINFIEKYMSYFYNESKKIIYYKNIIIKDTLTLLGEENTETAELIIKINNELLKLKKLNYKDYKDMLSFINYIYNTTLNNNEIDENIKYNTININKKINLYKLNLLIIDKSKKLLYPSSIYLKTIFNLFDYGKIDKTNTYLNDFISLFYKDLKITNKSGELIFNNIFTSQVEYLSLYIRNYISYSFLDNIPVKDTIDLINTYIILSKNIYFNSKDEDRVKTGIYEGIIFLGKLDNYIRNSLFKESRDNKGLLIKKGLDTYSTENIEKLKLNINKLNESIYKNLYLSKNEPTFNKIKNDFSEYFEALLDYELYLYNYDKGQSDILKVKTIGNDNNNSLSKEKLFKYLSKFKGISNNSLNNMDVQVMSDYYKVNKISIYGNIMSFDLYPNSKNKLNNIFIYGLEPYKQIYKNSAYFLDDIEKELKEKKNNQDEKDKEKYKFENFFINKFFSRDKTKVITKNNETRQENKVKESKVIILFKSKVLLGSKGEFKTIKDIITINYSDLIVTRDGDLYNTYINGSLLSIKDGVEKGKEKYGLLYGKYILNDYSHYFNKLSIKPYKIYKDDKKELGLSGNKINILGKINIQDFETRMNEIFNNIENIYSTYELINNIYTQIDNLNISYNIETSEVTFTLNNSNNNIEISFKGSTITKVNVNYNNIIINEPLSNLQNILLTIKN